MYKFVEWIIRRLIPLECERLQGYVDGMAASIASVIALAGDRVIVPSNAFLMIHKPWAACTGNADDCRKMAADLDAIETGIINIYKEHLAEGADIEDIQTMVAEETWRYFRRW